MIIAAVEDPDLIAKLGYPDSQTRSKDLLHVSTIYRDLMCDLQPKRFSREPFKMNNNVEVGILFETMLERALAEKYSTCRPGELVSAEGIAMSPDGVNPDSLAVEEYKCTWMSCRHGVTDENGQPLDRFVHWFVQMKTYCLHLEVTRALLRVLFVNGNYNRSGKLDSGERDPESGPTFKTYDITFTEDELQENWQLLIRHAQHKGMLP